MLPLGDLPQGKLIRTFFPREKFITLDRNRVRIKSLEWKWVVDDNQPDPSYPTTTLPPVAHPIVHPRDRKLAALSTVKDRANNRSLHSPELPHLCI